jgi:hypothetical protein
VAQPARPVARAESAAGHWIYTHGHGWVWVPDGAVAEEVDGVPYAYLYTPSYGWTWYVSPWGSGVYYPGAWINHPWHPWGTQVWVAPPHVVRVGPRGGHP